MRWRPPWLPIMGGRDPRHVEYDRRFIEHVLRLWDRGEDTFAISKIVFETEAVVTAALHIGLERRRTDPDWQ